MTEERKNHWKKIFAEHEKKRRRIEPIKRNQLSLWLGRLIIAYNSLENTLANCLTLELVELIGKDEPPKKPQLGYIPSALQRANSGDLNHIVMATIPFKQKLDFLTALLLKRFHNNEEQQKHINKIAGLLYAADEFRNKMVHSVWEVNHSEASRIKVKTKGRKGLKIDREDTDITQLRRACNAIDCVEMLCLFALTDKVDGNSIDLGYEKLESILRPPPNLKTYPDISLPDEPIK